MQTEKIGIVYTKQLSKQLRGNGSTLESKCNNAYQLRNAPLPLVSKKSLIARAGRPTLFFRNTKGLFNNNNSVENIQNVAEVEGILLAGSNKGLIRRRTALQWKALRMSHRKRMLLTPETPIISIKHHQKWKPSKEADFKKENVFWREMWLKKTNMLQLNARIYPRCTKKSFYEKS